MSALWGIDEDLEPFGAEPETHCEHGAPLCGRCNDCEEELAVVRVERAYALVEPEEAPF